MLSAMIQGLQTNIRYKQPLSYEQYITAYRELLLGERRQAIRNWVAGLNNDASLSFYCYCQRLPDHFDIEAEATSSACTQWFCHRWLIYKLLRSWKPNLPVELS